MGHGHVTPNADGSLARCGGPGLCYACSREQSDKIMAAATPLLLESMKREQEFWDRHDISSEGDKSGKASPAHRAWVKAVELEYELMGRDSRVHLDTPLARKAFILGYRISPPRSDSLDKPGGET